MSEKADVLDSIADRETLTWADRHALKAIAKRLRSESTAQEGGASCTCPITPSGWKSPHCRRHGDDP